MLVARVHGPKDVRVEDVPIPEVRPGTVKIAVEWAGICGTDLMIFDYAPVPVDFVHPLFGDHGPHPLGHEFAGYVAEVGPEVDGLAVGDLVTVQPNVFDGSCGACARGESNICGSMGFIGIHGGGGGFSEYVVAAADKVFKLPDPFTPETGALVEFLSVAYHAVRVSGAAAGSSAFVIGAGPIGLALVLALKAVGAETVIVSEMSDSRKEVAGRLGADVVDPRATDVVEYTRAQSGGFGADVSFDASGAGSATLLACLAALRNGGTSVVVANFHEPVAIDVAHLMHTEKKIVGSLAYTREDFEAVIAAVASGQIDPSVLITRRSGLSALVEGGLAHLEGEGRNTEVKILVSPRTSSSPL